MHDKAVPLHKLLSKSIVEIMSVKGLVSRTVKANDKEVNFD